MPKITIERYKVSLVSEGVRYKLLAHQVAEDESLFVEFRSPPREKHIVGGTVISTEKGIRIEEVHDRKDSRAHHLHYHPSGKVNIKRQDNTVINRLQFPPLILLDGALPLFMVSIASIDQLEIDHKKKDIADVDYDLDEYPVDRLHAEVWIGKKGVFDSMRPQLQPSIKVVYDDAALYDVAYFVGKSMPIDPDAIYGEVSLSNTRLIGVPSASFEFDIDPSHKDIPEYWSTPHAIARQFRAYLEHNQELVRKAVGGEKGHYEIKISFCPDGVLCSLDWHPLRTSPSYSMVTFDQLTIKQVINALSGKENELIDVYQIEPKIVNGPNTVYVRRSSKSNISNALVYVANDYLKGRYFRILPENIKNIGCHLELVGVQQGA